MKIAYNPKTEPALNSVPSDSKDIIFDLSGMAIYARGVKFDGKAPPIFKKHTISGGGYDGLVPAPSYNEDSKIRYLREDGTWEVPTTSSIHWDNITGKPSVFTPDQHIHTTNDIAALTNYIKATTAADLVVTDTLNAALGKLEYKADIAYSWYRSITDDDTDEIINKWDEIVDFVNNMSNDLTEEFVTRKTDLVITGVKTFLSWGGEKIKLENGNIISSLNTNGGWARALSFSNTSGDTSVSAYFGVYGLGINDGTNRINYAYIAHQNLNHSSATFKVYGDKATILNNEIYHKGNLKNLSDLNDDIVSGKYVQTKPAIHGNDDLNTKYDSLLAGSAVAANAPASYGSYLVMPYRKPYGNTKPDFAVQLFIPNGDTSTYQMYYRTSLADSWNEWRIVLDNNNFSKYALPLTGGTVTGNTTFESWLYVYAKTNNGSFIRYHGLDGAFLGGIGVRDTIEPFFYDNQGYIKTIYHSGNLTKLSQLTDDVVKGKYLPLSGGTMGYGAALKFNLYNNRFLNLTGNDITFTVTSTGGYTGGIYLETPTSNHDIITWSGNGTTGLRGIFLGGIDINSIIHSGNIASQSVAYATNAGNADTLDGVLYQNILERDYSGNLRFETTGWYRIGVTKNTNAAGNAFTLYLYRVFNNAPSEAHIINVTYTHNNTYSFTQVAGSGTYHLIKKIRIDAISGTNVGYIDIYYESSNANAVRWFTVGNAESYTTATQVTELTGTALEFDTAFGCKSSKGFIGDLTGEKVTFLSAGDKAKIGFYQGEFIDGYGNVQLGSRSESWNVFNSSRSALFTVLQSGNVGIGIPNPKHKLHVNGDLGLVGDLTFRQGSDSTPVYINSNSGSYYQRIRILDTTVSSSDVFTFQQSTNSGETYGDLFSIKANGKVTSTGFIKQDSSDSYVLLGGGDHKAISDFLLKSELANQELNNNLTTISKSLTVTADWMDTGITRNDLPSSGTYIVLVYTSAGTDPAYMYYCYWSGIMSWLRLYNTNDDEADEILLHRSGHAYGNTIYLRTKMVSNGDLKLLIAANKNINAAYTYTFKFKRVI